MSSDSGQRSAQTAGENTPTDAGGSDDAVDPEDLPLPPYPPNVGGPSMQVLQQMFDVTGFGEKAMLTNDVIRARMPGEGDVYTLGHPDHLKRAFLTERHLFQKSDDFNIAFGQGLLTVEGEEWQEQHDILQPLFTRDSVMDYADGMVEQVRRRSDRWSDGDRFDLQAQFTDMTLDVLFATVLGRELAIDGDQDLREAAESLHDWFHPPSYLMPRWVPTPARRRFKKGKATLEQEAQRLLDEKSGNAPTDPSDAEDLLSLLVGLREAGVDDSGMLDDKHLRDQMVTIIFAGHDTTTTSLTFAFWALANHPEVRERFHEEVDALDGPPTLDDLDDLEVTERVLTETLRMFPPVFNLPRRTTETVEVDGYRIPEDSQVLLSIRAAQRDSRFYDAPDEFRPSRWDGDLRSNLHNFAYCPFAGGPRICIGREFALLEAKLAMATIGREYDLYWLGDNEPDGEPPVSPQMTMRMEEGQEFMVVER